MNRAFLGKLAKKTVFWMFQSAFFPKSSTFSISLIKLMSKTVNLAFTTYYSVERLLQIAVLCGKT